MKKESSGNGVFPKDRGAITPSQTDLNFAWNEARGKHINGRGETLAEFREQREASEVWRGVARRIIEES